MYLEHFNLKAHPFSLTPNIQFYCRLFAHQSALNVLLVSLKNGEGFIKITGEVGTGKTLLCRKLLDNLSNDHFVTAYIPNPDLTPSGLHKALAQELGIDLAQHLDQHTIQLKINDRLIELNQQDKQVVLLIDEAQSMPTITLETLRLLTNLETESNKLLHIVLFAQPELNHRLKQKNLRQLRQRITFSYHLTPLKRHELVAYINHRLAIAGFTYGNLFTRHAHTLLFRSSNGIPRVINILCHKAMMAAYGQNKKRIDARAMRRAIKDSQELNLPSNSFLLLTKTGVIALAGIIIGLFVWHFHLVEKLL